MSTKKQRALLKNISDLLGVDTYRDAHPFDFRDTELIRIQDELKSYKAPALFKIQGYRPEKKTAPSEHGTHYRLKMSFYIKLNTGISLPVSCNIRARFYDDIADFLKL